LALSSCDTLYSTDGFVAKYFFLAARQWHTAVNLFPFVRETILFKEEPCATGYTICVVNVATVIIYVLGDGLRTDLLYCSAFSIAHSP